MHRDDLEQINTDLARLTTLVHQIRQTITTIHDKVRTDLYPPKYLEDLDYGHSEPRCEHLIPIGDFCPKCAPHHCTIHDTDTIGRCPYCVDTHRVDTPEG